MINKIKIKSFLVISFILFLSACQEQGPFLVKSWNESENWDVQLREMPSGELFCNALGHSIPDFETFSIMSTGKGYAIILVRLEKTSFGKDTILSVDGNPVISFALPPPDWKAVANRFKTQGIINSDAAKTVFAAIQKGKTLTIEGNPPLTLPLDAMPKVLDDMTECIQEGTKMGGTFKL